MLIEMQSSVRPPEFLIKINEAYVSYETEIYDTADYVTRLICKIEPVALAQSNQLCVIMQDKTDEDNIHPVTGEYVDHFVSVKQIRIDDIDADAMVFANSSFQHCMPQTWIENMRSQGHDILPIYAGSDLHLNGCMTFEFEMPFWLARTKFMHQIGRKNRSKKTMQSP
jgi:hypothetical protein